MSSSNVLGEFTIRELARLLFVVGLELMLVATAAGASYIFAMWVIGRAVTPRFGAIGEAGPRLQGQVRRAIVALSALLVVTIVGYNGWLAARGADVPSETLALLSVISTDLWASLAVAVSKIAAAIIAVIIAARVVRRLLRAAEDGVNRWDQIRSNDQSLAVLFAGLNRAIAFTAWMLVVVYALQLLGVPEAVRSGLLMIVRAYIVIAVGLLLIRSSVVIVDTLDGLSQKYAETRGWLRYYEHLHSLVPTFRTCLEYALWVAMVAGALLQLGTPGGALAAWGPGVIQAIAIFFLGRAVIELGRYEIQRRMLVEGLDDASRRRRSTMAPLVRSAFTYSVYFATAVLVLATLGFNPLPFLAGAGILGLVIGFGAQSLINDVVSGFFILFENTYLIGDLVETAGAKGVVEAIEFRTTKIRDSDGRVHIIRNGDVKDVTNYSKDYTMAVVLVDVAYEADLRLVFATLREAAARLRRESADVLAETQIDGITAFGPVAMTVRTSTRVKPGRHDSAAAALRLTIKEEFDRRAAGPARHGVVPDAFVNATTDPRDRRHSHRSPLPLDR